MYDRTFIVPSGKRDDFLHSVCLCMFIVCVDVCLCGHEFLRACGKFAGSFTLTLSSRVFVQAGEPGTFIYVK